MDDCIILDQRLENASLPVRNDFLEVCGEEVAGTIGASFFENAVFTFDHSAAELYLDRGDSSELASIPGVRVRLRESNYPLPVTDEIMESHLGKRRHAALVLDTGTAFSMLTAEYLSRPKRNPLTRWIMRKSLRASALYDWGFRLPNGYEVCAPVVIHEKFVEDEDFARVDGILGMSVLHELWPIFDFRTGSCIFTGIEP